MMTEDKNLELVVACCGFIVW